MKKKFLALVLALTLALSMAACGGKDAPAQDGEPDAPQTGAPGNGETGSPDAAPEEAEGGSPDTAPEQEGNGETEDPEENQGEVNLTNFYNTLREENTWPELMNLTEDATMTELLDSYYPGLSAVSTKQCGVYVAAISAAVGEIALVEVENAEDVQAVKDIFQARIDYQVGDDANPGGAWYPETIEGWKTKSHVVSHGNYVMLAVGDAAGAAVESFEALFA